jgi:hypothetical protein
LPSLSDPFHTCGSSRRPKKLHRQVISLLLVLTKHYYGDEIKERERERWTVHVAHRGRRETGIAFGRRKCRKCLRRHKRKRVILKRILNKWAGVLEMYFYGLEY